MSVTSHAKAEWNGSLKEGGGRVSFTGFSGDYTWAGRFQTGKGTNPEELIAAAHAGCYSMQLSGLLTSGGHPPKSIHTNVSVKIEGGGVGIVSIAIETEAEVPGLGDADFQATAAKAKEICPVSKALAAVHHITLHATLKA